VGGWFSCPFPSNPSRFSQQLIDRPSLARTIGGQPEGGPIRNSSRSCPLFLSTHQPTAVAINLIWMCCADGVSKWVSE
jgi:hypothetical protein